MAKQINSFDDWGMRKIATAVSRLKVQQENLHKQVHSLVGVKDQQPIQVRTGITMATDKHPDYPSKGCHLPFAYHDLEFNPAVINACPDTEKRKWGPDSSGVTIEETGRSLSGYIPENTEILFVEVPTPIGRRFWIFKAESETTFHWLIARENLRPYEKNKKAALAFYDVATDTWIDDGSDTDGEHQLHDDSGVACLLPGEMVFCSQRPHHATHNPDGLQWDIISNTGTRRRIKVQADVECGADGVGEVWSDDKNMLDCKGIETAPLMELPFCNKGTRYLRKLFGPETSQSPAKQDFIWIEWDGYHWYPFRVERPTQATAIAADGFCEVDQVTTAKITYKDWKDGDCESDNDNIDTLDNSTFRLIGEGGQKVDLRWDEEDAGNKDGCWDIVQVRHYVEEFVEDVYDYNGGQGCPILVRDRFKAGVMRSTLCGTPQDGAFLTFNPAYMTGNVYFDEQECRLFAQAIEICVPGQPTLYPPVPITNGGKMTVVTAVTKTETTDEQTGKVTACKIEMTTVDVCALSLPYASPSQPASIDFKPQQNVSDVVSKPDDGLYQYVGTQWTLCTDPPVEELIEDYTDCPEDQ